MPLLPLNGVLTVVSQSPSENSFTSYITESKINQNQLFQQVSGFRHTTTDSFGRDLVVDIIVEHHSCLDCGSGRELQGSHCRSLAA